MNTVTFLNPQRREAIKGFVPQTLPTFPCGVKKVPQSHFGATSPIGSLVGFLEQVFYSAKTRNFVAWMMQIVCFGHVSAPPLSQAMQLLPRVLCLYCWLARPLEKVLDSEM